MATSTRKGSEATRKSGASPAAPKSAARGDSQAAGGASTAFSAPEKMAQSEHGGDGPAQSTDLERRIAERAYEIYRQRGGEEGDPVKDWLQAEAEIRGSRSAVDESQARSSRVSEKQQPGTGPDKEMQEFNRASAGGI